MHTSSTTPFAAGETETPTLRQRAIAALIQQIWDQSSQTVERGCRRAPHHNWGVPQSKLPPVDRWANTFSAFVLDRWVNAYAARFGGLRNLASGSQGEQRAAHVLFMLWSLARFGAHGSQAQARRQPTCLQDIPAGDLALMQSWWERSLDPDNSEIDRQFEDAFAPTFPQALLDRSIARAAVGCQSLAQSDLGQIAHEQAIAQWAERLAGLKSFCEILRRQAEARACPTMLITGPTSTGKSPVAWALARMLDGVVIAADPFQICAVPPIALGVGLPAHLPPPGIRTLLYRSRTPESHRPSPETTADWVATALAEEACRGRPRIIEGGSVSVAMALLKRAIPTHVVVFHADPRHAADVVQTRMAADGMNRENLLAEAQSLRDRGLEHTWVARDSVVYPELFAVLDRARDMQEVLCRIAHDWQALVADQQSWFADLRAMDVAMCLPPTRQSPAGVREILRC